VKNIETRKILAISIVIAFTLSLFAAMPALAQEEEEGEIVEEIYMEVETEEHGGVAETIEGEIDVFMHATPARLVEDLDPDRDHLGVIESAGSYNNLLFNPARTNKYTAEVDGEVLFNPFAIREVRYAMNWTVDRELIVDEIYDGFAEPRYLPVSLGYPGWDEYFEPIIEEHGISPEGNIEKAREMVTDALEETQEDPELVGELDKLEDDDSPVGYWWAYRGPEEEEFEPIVLDIIQRVDDERDEIGTLVAGWIEELGLKTEEHPMEREAASALTLFNDPLQTLDEWNIYTGGWMSAAAAYYDETGTYQMYTDLLPFMPGHLIGADWTYDTPEISEVARPLQTGALEDEEEYFDTWAQTADMGLEDSIRVFKTTSFDFYPYDDERVTNYVTDVIVGWSDWFTPRTMKTTDGTLNMAQYTPAAELFMDVWNRIAGEDDVYTVEMTRMLRDETTIFNPTTGRVIPMRTDWRDVTREVEFEEGEPIMELEVPEDAVDYDVEEREWAEVGEDVEAATSVTYEYKFSRWHDGSMMDDHDLAAWYAYAKEWATEEGERFNSVFAGEWAPVFDSIKGVEWHGDGEVTIYGDYLFPPEGEIANYYAGVINPHHPWHVDEAWSTLVEVGDSPVHGDEYAWEVVEGTRQVNYIVEEQGEDVEAVLEEKSEEGEIPPYLREANNAPFTVTEETLEERAQNANSFFEEYAHYYISQGPFVLTDYDIDDQTMDIERFTNLVEDANYPFEGDYWYEREELELVFLSFGTIDAPATAAIGEELNISVPVEEDMEFPQQLTQPAERGQYTIDLVREGEVVYTVEEAVLEAGQVTGTIPAEDTAELEPGGYEIVISGEIEGEPLGTAETSTSIILEEIAPIGLSNLSIDPTVVEAGEEYTVYVDVINNLEVEEEYDFELMIDGASVDSASGILAAGDTTTLEFSVTAPDEAGEFDVQVGDLTTSVTVEEPEPELGIGLIAGIVVVVIVLLIVGVFYYKKQSE